MMHAQSSQGQGSWQSPAVRKILRSATEVESSVGTLYIRIGSYHRTPLHQLLSPGRAYEALTTQCQMGDSPLAVVHLVVVLCSAASMQC